MLRAVLDANVIISALTQPKGASGQILTRLFDADSFELIVSPAILAELRRSLSYPKVRKYIKSSDEDLDLWVASLELIAQPVDGNIRIHAVAEDPDDEKYIEAAVEGLAQFVVTGDKHLLSLKSYENIRIVTPRVFRDLLQDTSSRAVWSDRSSGIGGVERVRGCERFSDCTS